MPKEYWFARAVAEEYVIYTIVCTVFYALQTAYCNASLSTFTVYNILYTMCYVLCTTFCVLCTTYDVLCTMYYLDSIMYWLLRAIYYVVRARVDGGGRGVMGIENVVS